MRLATKHIGLSQKVQACEQMIWSDQDLLPVDARSRSRASLSLWKWCSLEFSNYVGTWQFSVEVKKSYDVYAHSSGVTASVNNIFDIKTASVL
jgi:hypothetical protein